jgi:uncharacterized iron-regulated membrane protein
LRSWRKFRLRLLPERLTPPAVARHHRDLGALAAPFLFLSCLTGAMMTIEPLSRVLLSAFSPPSVMKVAAAPPTVEGGPLSPAADWRAMAQAALAEFPGSELRIVSLPRAEGDLISMRLRQPAEWHPNGRSMVWLDPATGAVVGSRDALALPTGLQVSHGVYPLHAGMVGGPLYRLAITLTGLTLATLGGLATWSFWFRRGGRRKGRSAAPERLTPGLSP